MKTTLTFKIAERAVSCEEFGKIDATRIETVHSSGKVEGRLFGTWDGDEIDERYTHDRGPLDLATVRDARIKMGWSTVG